MRRVWKLGASEQYYVRIIKRSSHEELNDLVYDIVEEPIKEGGEED